MEYPPNGGFFIFRGCYNTIQLGHPIDRHLIGQHHLKIKGGRHGKQNRRNIV